MKTEKITEERYLESWKEHINILNRLAKTEGQEKEIEKAKKILYKIMRTNSKIYSEVE